jgi:hypothetical protein
VRRSFQTVSLGSPVNRARKSYAPVGRVRGLGVRTLRRAGRLGYEHRQRVVGGGA